MAKAKVSETRIPRNGKYLHYGNIILAAQHLTGSKAKTKKGAWQAIKKNHLTEVFGTGLQPGWRSYIPTEVVGAARPGYGMAKDDPRLMSYRRAWARYQWRERAERGAEKIMRSMGLMSRWESLQAGGGDDWERGLVARKRQLLRDNYGALCAEQFYHHAVGAESQVIRAWLQQQDPLKAAQECIRAIESHGADEHGGWNQYIDFDEHGRGSCVNVDVYGIDDKNNLFVIQVRQFSRLYKGGYGNVRKTYFLIGYNENGNPFAHPVSAQKIHAAIKKDDSPISPVKAAQAWIWGIREDQLESVLRNGDTALVPAKRPNRIAEDITPKTGIMRVIDSHHVYSRKILRNGATYALDPTLRHFKGQHPTVKGSGWYKIIIGNRADHHDFAVPTID